jgi:hypothetical protein
MSGCNLGLDVRRFGMIFGKRKRVTSNPAKVLHITGWIREYPMGIFDSEDIDVDTFEDE